MFLRHRRLEVSRETQISCCLGQSVIAASNWTTLESTVTDHRLLPCNPLVCYTQETAKESVWRNTASCAMTDSGAAGYDTRQNDNPGDDDIRLLICVNIYQYKRRLVPKDSSIQTHCCENLTSRWWKRKTKFARKLRWCSFLLFFKISGEGNGYHINNNGYHINNNLRITIIILQ